MKWTAEDTYICTALAFICYAYYINTCLSYSTYGNIFSIAIVSALVMCVIVVFIQTASKRKSATALNLLNGLAVMICATMSTVIILTSASRHVAKDLSFIETGATFLGISCAWIMGYCFYEKKQEKQ